ncbi:hypothetical protein AB3Y40_05105 [Yoonia sp. R2331]|uniref:hypothetical protein n=1 Tax=Yoonia sp. R2331 TaxID=3237238 RepID=UPI0034E53BC4
MAQTAWACPVAEDLATGIRVTAADGTVDVYRDLGDGTVAQEIDFGDGSVAKNVLARGVYVLRLAVEDGGVLDLDSVMQTTYDRNPAAMVPPTPGMQDKLRTTITDTSGSYKELQSHNWGESTEVRIGECTYEGIVGDVRYDSDEGAIVETVHYLPALGLGLLMAYTYDDEPTETYDLIRIEAVQ